MTSETACDLIFLVPSNSPGIQGAPWLGSNAQLRLVTTEHGVSEIAVCFISEQPHMKLVTVPWFGSTEQEQYHFFAIQFSLNTGIITLDIGVFCTTLV